ncbi:hypothetical protein L1D44_04305 [Shewanella sp. Isolate13]|uniref:hypothetical protein n=1 Tax=Shewanella sp. Isolate13 TaxID=2908531 RepID=UPI001EFEA0AA|nr:hypothetical protein [Shewanella sp. Isolate13]MCG9729068.1 hypothetical protein [Shewanella sp. Isolate13]
MRLMGGASYHSLLPATESALFCSQYWLLHVIRYLIRSCSPAMRLMGGASYHSLLPATESALFCSQYWLPHVIRYLIRSCSQPNLPLCALWEAQAITHYCQRPSLLYFLASIGCSI